MDNEKSVDESWKESAKAEKKILDSSGNEIHSETPQAQEEAPEAAAGEARQIEINFINYITSLGFQALIFMGEIPNPITNTVEKNLIQSKFIIDTLVMLKEKTKNNLNEQESSFLESSIHDLQLKYVEVVNKEKESAETEMGEKSE